MTPFYNDLRSALAREEVADSKRDQRAMPELRRVGYLIRVMRKRGKNPTRKLAERVGLTINEWYGVERGTHRLSFSTLRRVLDLLGMPLEAVFNARNDDFFPFVLSKVGKDPDDLTARDADDLYDDYLNGAMRHNREGMPELRRVGRLIRAMRKRGRNPTRKLAERVGLTVNEWYAVEQGAHRLSFSNLRRVLDLLDIPVKTVFNSGKDDFFPFVRLACGTDPADLKPEEADEIYGLYLEILKFRREVSKGPARRDRNTQKMED